MTASIQKRTEILRPEAEGKKDLDKKAFVREGKKRPAHGKGGFDKVKLGGGGRHKKRGKNLPARPLHAGEKCNFFGKGKKKGRQEGGGLRGGKVVRPWGRGRKLRVE